MKTEKNQLCDMSPEQLNPYLAQPTDFAIVEDGVAFHRQCGSNKAEYRKLLNEADGDGGKSNFVDGEQDRPTEASDASRPHTR